MRQFHHVGVITTKPQPNEIYVPETKVHVTNPNDHPDRLEFLRYEPDSPVTGPLRERPHVAFKVPDITPEMDKGEVILGPFRPMPNIQAVFVLIEGAVFEFMQFEGDSDFDGLS